MNRPLLIPSSGAHD